MSFCTKCGTKIAEGAKFCTRCGQKVVAFTPTHAQPSVMPVPEPVVPAPRPIYETPAPQSEEIPVPVYTEAAPQPTAAPAAPIPEPIYEAPASMPFPAYEAPAAPKQPEPAPASMPFPAYEAPAAPKQPEPAPAPMPFPAYEAPAATKQLEPPLYQPPVYQTPEPPKYQPPVRKEAPAEQNPFDVPWQKSSASNEKKSGSKVGVIIACVVGALAVIGAFVIGLILLFGGKGNPNLGLYEAVSCQAYGVELGVEDEWIELKSHGKATLSLMGEEYNCKWSLDGEDLTIKQGGDEYQGTLADGTITISFDSMVYTYEKEGREPSSVENTIQPELPAQVGTWTLLRAEGDDAMDEETVAMLRDMGIVIYLELNADGTGTVCIDEPYAITWEDNVLVAEDGNEAVFAVVDGELLLEIDGSTLIFVPGEIGDQPVADEPVEVAPVETEPESFDEMSNIREYWEGEWYGWWIIWSGSGSYAEDEDTGSDAYARISVYDDGTGYLTLWDATTSADDPMAECSISFDPYASETGIMFSQEGHYLDDDIEATEWYVDPQYSVVSAYDHMIIIEGNYVDPEDYENSYEYYIILRPWGMSWDDVPETENPDDIYDDMMPFRYDSWYLPLLEMGVAQMPDSLEDGEALIEAG